MYIVVWYLGRWDGEEGVITKTACVDKPVLLWFLCGLKLYNHCRSILTAVEAHYKDPSSPYPGEDNSMIYELTPYLETAGINDPLTKVVMRYKSILCYL